MSNPVQLRIRGPDEVRDVWMATKGTFDMTHGEFALEAAKFISEREQEFQRHLQSDERDSETERR